MFDSGLYAAVIHVLQWAICGGYSCLTVSHIRRLFMFDSGLYAAVIHVDSWLSAVVIHVDSWPSAAVIHV